MGGPPRGEPGDTALPVALALRACASSYALPVKPEIHTTPVFALQQRCCKAPNDATASPVQLPSASFAVVAQRCCYRLQSHCIARRVTTRVVIEIDVHVGTSARPLDDSLRPPSQVAGAVP